MVNLGGIAGNVYSSTFNNITGVSSGINITNSTNYQVKSHIKKLSGDFFSEQLLISILSTPSVYGARGCSGIFFEYFGKITLIFKSHLTADLSQAQIGFKQQFLCFFHSHSGDEAA